MLAAVLEEFNKPLVLRQVNIQRPGPHEVLVRTAAVSLCHSDLHFIEGTRPLPLPAILGHEVAGVVDEIGPGVDDLAPGDRVVGALAVHCGTCPRCLDGRQTLCSNTSIKQPPGQARRLSMDGRHIAQVYNLSAFAEAFLTHRNALVKIPQEMPLDRAALLGCAVTTGTGAVFNTAGVRPGDSVVVIGAGGVGLAAVNGARIAGADKVIAVDRLGAKIELARAFGATHGIDASRDDVVARVMEITNGGADHAIECVGHAATVEQAFRSIRPAGRRGNRRSPTQEQLEKFTKDQRDLYRSVVKNFWQPALLRDVPLQSRVFA